MFGQSPAGNRGYETTSLEDGALCWVLLVTEGRLGETLAQGRGTVGSRAGAWVQALDTEPGAPLLWFFPSGGRHPDPALSILSECAMSCGDRVETFSCVFLLPNSFFFPLQAQREETL